MNKADTAVEEAQFETAFVDVMNNAGNTLQALGNAIFYGAAWLCFKLGNGILNIRAFLADDRKAESAPCQRGS
jgi:hypothetical protein